MKGHRKDVEKMAKGFRGDTWVLFYSFVNVQVNPNLKPKEKNNKNFKNWVIKKHFFKSWRHEKGPWGGHSLYEALEEKGYF